MKILYDYQIFRSQRYGGISRYFTNLIKQSPKEDAIVPVFHSKNYYYNKLSGRFDYQYESMIFEWLNNTISKWMTKRALRGTGIDIFHPTSNDPYFLKLVDGPKIIITVHDLVREFFPQFFKNTDLYMDKRRQILTAADHIIAVSKNTKEDLIEMYGVSEDKITVVYHGLPQQFGRLHVTLRGLPKKYILFVGQRDRNKNFDAFLQAVGLIMDEDKDLCLLCVGGGEFTPEERDMIREYGLTRQVRQRNLNDAILAACYRSAEFFVFPSLYEGFGIPILEAFSMECPILLSDIGCFREVAGEAGIYFDPTSIVNMEKTIRWALDPQNNEILRQKASVGKSKVEGFTLEKTYHDTIAVYANALGIPSEEAPNETFG